MASARVLSTTELGLLRYDSARSAGLWPVEVVLRSPVSTATYLLLVPGRAPVPFVSTRTGRSHASLEVPPGPLTYEVRSAGALVSTGGLDVRPPQKPIANTRLAAALSERPPSGAVQLTPREAAALPSTPQMTRAGYAPVRFLFTEETWAAREVFVEAEFMVGGKAQLGRKVNGGDFEAVVGCKPGGVNYRFCVVPREATPIHAAPFTRLGWDSARSEPSWLVTWPLTIGVKHIGPSGKEVGEGLVAHEQRVIAEVEGGEAKGKAEAEAEAEAEAKAKAKAEAEAEAEAKAGQKMAVGVAEGKKNGVVWGVVVAVAAATVACAVGVGVALLIGRREGEKEKEVEVKKDVEAEVKKERDAKVKKEREAKVKKEREAKVKKERDAKVNKERDAKVKKERGAKVKNERDAKVKNERDVKVKNERDAKVKNERDAKVKNERDAKVKKERDAKMKKEMEATMKEVEVKVKKEVSRIKDGAGRKGEGEGGDDVLRHARSQAF